MQLIADCEARPAPRIVMMSASVGAGHDGAARELTDRLRSDGFVVDRVDFLDLLPAGLGRFLRGAYAWQLRRVPGSWGWLLQALQRHGLLALVASHLVAAVTGRRVAQAVASADVVVSTYPLASQALGQLRRRGHLSAPVATYLTDMSVHRLWVADGVDAHLALHPVPAAQAHELGAHGVRVAGPAVSPAFRPRSEPSEQDTLRSRLGLPYGTPLALVVAGSWGVGDIDSTVEDIARCGVVTPVVACGRNSELYQRLMGTDAIPVGWTDDMPSLVRACDVVVQNAGGLSSLEARACDIPVLTYRCLPGHGLTNAAALDEAGWAPWIRTRDELRVALKAAVAGELPRCPDDARDDPAKVIAALATHPVGVHA